MPRTSDEIVYSFPARIDTSVTKFYKVSPLWQNFNEFGNF